jgi:uncharacterized protein
MKRFLLVFICLLSSVALAQDIKRTDFQVQLGSFTSSGQITYPSTGKAPFPTILLIHGSTPMDMNATIAFGTKTHSSIFLQIAEFLSQKGFAVVRYNKRFVRGVNNFDATGFYQTTLNNFLSDARTVLEFAKQQPIVDPNKTFVYGWSEGSPIAAQMALTDSSIRGIITQGTVAYSYAKTASLWFPNVGLPYLKRFATDGKLDLAAVQRAISGNGGLLARGEASYLLDFQSSTPKLNPFMDTNRDGLIDLESEAKPVFAFVRQDKPEFLGNYASSLALPGLIDVAPKLRTPILVLQGENDANTPVAGTRELENILKNNNNAQVKIYANLGHSLGLAKDAIDDDFRPIEQAPLEDIRAFIEQYSH